MACSFVSCVPQYPVLVGDHDMDDPAMPLSTEATCSRDASAMVEEHSACLPGPGTELPSEQVGKPELEDALQGVDVLHHSQPGPETGVTYEQDGQPAVTEHGQEVVMQC